MADVMRQLQIRPATIDDADAIARIYAYYVANTVISFEEEPVSASEMARRITEVGSSSLPWLVAAQDGNRLVGYAYAVRWKGRSAYRHSVESSVYLDPACIGRGFGTRLYQALLQILRERSIHTVIGGIGLPNPASVALHERLGFTQVAHFKEVGYKFGRWIDVGYWQRSP